MENRTLIAAVALAAFAASAPASAESFKFRYMPHELETAGGRDAMMDRLDRLAGNYCRIDDWRGIHTRRASKECKIEVVAEITAKIQNVEFAALVE